MNQGTVAQWKRVAAVLITALAVHIVARAMILAGYSVQTRNLGGPTILGVVILVGLFWSGVWIARRLWNRWLALLGAVSMVYAGVGLLRLRFAPDPVDAGQAAFQGAARLAFTAILFWVVVISGTRYWKVRRSTASVVSNSR
jgi:hypothetical protein